jgi:2-oxoglutarate dehydrogenase E2 component (dihydrolipoamide succinyltransferase)
VSSPRGLVVPVLRNVERMSYMDIEKRLGELAAKARLDQIAIEDMAGGTFTVSNGGVFGSLMGTPIINPPQSAILGMHATKMRPVAIAVRNAQGALLLLPPQAAASALPCQPPLSRPLPPTHALTHTRSLQGKVEIRPVMYLALTYDHRLIDGREAVLFLAGVRDKVEDPRRLLVGL